MGSDIKDQRMRQRLAQEAARIMAQEGVHDFGSAKRKAAQRLGADQTRNLPGNDEIEQALREYQRLFKADTQQAALHSLRTTALELMEFLREFQPRLVGAVWRGTADETSTIQLHLFSDTPEALGMLLMDEGVPYDESDRRYTYNNGDSVSYPMYEIDAGDRAAQLTVFPLNGLRQAPQSSIDGRPMRRASIQEVRALLAADQMQGGLGA